MISRRRLLISAIATPALLNIGATKSLFAQPAPFPSRPIRLIVPYGAGGGPDSSLRVIAKKVEDLGGATIVIENKPGAGGTVGSVAAKQAAPDGYNLLMGDNATHAANATLVKNLLYDPVTDFEPITRLFVFTSVLLVPATSGVSTIKELHELARTKPGGLTYASPGLGSSSHLIGAMLSKEFQTPMTHVAYRSSSDARADVLAGRVDFMFNSLLPFRGDVEVGTIKALAVVSHERISNAPNVPTMAEVGFPGVDLQGWFGLFAPAKTDADIIMKLNQIFVTAAANVSDFIAQQGFIVRTSTPAELRELVKNDVAKYAVIIKEANAAPQ